MSNIFKRPCLEKVVLGGGIMNNVVERGQYAESNAKDFTTLKDRIDFIEGLGGKTGLDDPLTRFLLELGPNIVGQTGGGGTIGNILCIKRTHS